MKDFTMKNLINRPDAFIPPENASPDGVNASGIIEKRLKVINEMIDKKVSEKEAELAALQARLDEFDLYSAGKLDISIDEASKKFKNLDISEEKVRDKVFKLEEEIENLKDRKDMAAEHYDDIVERFNDTKAIDADGSFEKFVEDYIINEAKYRISDNDIKDIIEKRRN